MATVKSHGLEVVSCEEEVDSLSTACVAGEPRGAGQPPGGEVRADSGSGASVSGAGVTGAPEGCLKEIDGNRDAASEGGRGGSKSPGSVLGTSSADGKEVPECGVDGGGDGGGA